MTLLMETTHKMSVVFNNTNKKDSELKHLSNYKNRNQTRLRK